MKQKELSMGIHHIQEVIYVLDEEIYEIEQAQQRKNISARSYFKLQDRAIRLYQSIDFLKSELDPNYMPIAQD